MRVLSLDLGDAWVGSALSDPLGITCKPYKTVRENELHTFLENLFSTMPDITTVVIGLPTTMGNTESAQTKKVREITTALEKKYQQKKWVLFDERMTSQWATTQQHTAGKNLRDKKVKQEQHSVAAAFILQNYLDGRSF